MTLKEFWAREKHVALNGQSRTFRIRKWLVILVVEGLLFWRQGWQVALSAFLVCALLGVCVHFVLRWKTDRWTKDWGPYKKIKLENEV